MALLGIPKFITIHCSANIIGTGTVKQINETDIQRFGQKSYHFIIDYDGNVINNLPLSTKGAHVGGHNSNNVGICYLGGLDKNLIAADTRTINQRNAMALLVNDLAAKYPNIKIMGHRDWSPDKNGDGKISPNEYVKICPCFDVKEWWNSTKKTKG